MDSEVYFARIYAADTGNPNNAATAAISLPQNSHRRLTERASQSGESDGDNSSFFLGVAFDDIPKTNDGIVFGWAASCDVVLPRLPALSGRHFALRFDAADRLVVRDLGSAGGTSVTYDGAGAGLRRDFTWIVGDCLHTRGNAVVVHVADDVLRFRIVASRFVNPPSHGLARFRAATAAAPDAPDDDGDDDDDDPEDPLPTPPPAGLRALFSDPIFLREEAAGEGADATEARVWNVSTGEESTETAPSAGANEPGQSERARRSPAPSRSPDSAHGSESQANPEPMFLGPDSLLSSSPESLDV